MPDYPFDEFITHFDEIHASGKLVADGWFANVRWSVTYMKERYADPVERQFKIGRFMLIVQYLAEHLEEFDQGAYGVYGSPAVGGLVSRRVIRATHEVFTTRALGNLETSPEEIMRLADSYDED